MARQAPASHRQPPVPMLKPETLLDVELMAMSPESPRAEVMQSASESLTRLALATWRPMPVMRPPQENSPGRAIRLVWKRARLEAAKRCLLGLGLPRTERRARANPRLPATLQENSLVKATQPFLEMVRPVPANRPLAEEDLDLLRTERRWVRVRPLAARVKLRDLRRRRAERFPFPPGRERQC